MMLYKNILIVVSWECITLAVFTFLMNLPFEKILIVKRELSIIFALFADIAAIAYICYTGKLSFASIFILVLLTALFVTGVIFLIFETSWQHSYDDYCILELSDDYTSFSNASDVFASRSNVIRSDGKNIYFGLLRPCTDNSFTAYCIPDTRELASKSDYRCILYSYYPGFIIILEDILLFLFALIYPVLRVFNVLPVIESALLSFIIISSLRKFLSIFIAEQNRKARFFYFILMLLEFFSVFMIIFNLIELII